MNEVRTKKTAYVGVIIGRFQVHKLHQAHIELIEEVKKRHKRVVIMIGSTPSVKVTRRNPLDYSTRRIMIQKKFPEVIIIPINDHPSNEAWSGIVDAKISELFDLESTALLYGSRDGFIPYYSGKHNTIELEAKHTISGSEVRRMVSDDVREHHEFRRGAIYAAFNSHKTIFQCVDLAIINKMEGGALSVGLGRKSTDPEGIWRFPGGFIDPEDDCLELSARREGKQELGGIEFSDLRYVCSHKVDDWRYRNEINKIMTVLFTATYMFGTIKGSDDLQEACWMELHLDDIELMKSKVVKGHQPLMENLINYLLKGVKQNESK